LSSNIVKGQGHWEQKCKNRFRRPYVLCLPSSAVVCNVCIVSKRCVLEQKLILTAYIGSRIWGIDWH